MTWKEISKTHMFAWYFGFGLLLIALLSDTDGFLWIVDHANLAFHEAGHIFFGLFGRTLHLYGGTLGQFVFPLVCGIVFWRKRETLGFGVCGVWFFENFRYVATYAADARAQRLPLVGGGNHDWYAILKRWGALQYDQNIANIFLWIAWLGMIMFAFWIGYRFWQDRQIS